MRVNGWAVINASYTWDEELSDHYYDTVRDIEARIVENPSLFELVTLRCVNGLYVVQVALHTNHYRGDTDDILKLFEYVGQVASGSYGQISLYDDEGQYGDMNTTYLAVLVRGTVTRTKDPFFTPYLPNVEAPDHDLYPDAKLSDMVHKYLPLGSIVRLNGGEKRLMIFGRLQKDTANDKVFDYVGCPYPEGNIAPKATFLFQHEDIAWIHYLGLVDAEEQAWNEKLQGSDPEISSNCPLTGEFDRRLNS